MSPARPELVILLAERFPSWINFINQLLLKVYGTDFLQPVIDFTCTNECCGKLTSAIASVLIMGLTSGAE
jgi:hypothetical protein